MASFIIALLMASILTLVISQIETQNSTKTIIFAKSALVGRFGITSNWLFHAPTCPEVDGVAIN